MATAFHGRSGMRIAGVDGCRTGWVLASRTDEGPVAIEVLPGFREVLARGFNVVAIDIPIGLPAAGPRTCDRLARERLGPRRNSVFSCPIRPVLAAGDHEEACRIGRAVDGRGISRQTWNILPKIREVDGLLEPELASRVFEVHPELSFLAMQDGTPLAWPKKCPEGVALRRALLEQCLGQVPSGRLPGASDDDVMDALAALWSGGRIARGEAERLSADGEIDPRGIEMAIRF